MHIFPFTFLFEQKSHKALRGSKTRKNYNNIFPLLIFHLEFLPFYSSIIYNLLHVTQRLNLSRTQHKIYAYLAWTFVHCKFFSNSFLINEKNFINKIWTTPIRMLLSLYEKSSHTPKQLIFMCTGKPRAINSRAAKTKSN